MRAVLLDLSEVTRRDPTLFHLLTQAESVLARRGVRLSLVGLSRPVLNVLDDADLDDLMVVLRLSRCRTVTC